MPPHRVRDGLDHVHEVGADRGHLLGDRLPPDPALQLIAPAETFQPGVDVGHGDPAGTRGCGGAGAARSGAYR